MSDTLFDDLKKLLVETQAEPLPTPPGPGDADTLVHEVVHAYLLWEANGSLAADGMAKLLQTHVDWNELRVSFSDEASAVLGARYPLATERCERLRATLNDVYEREDALTLDRLRELSKREARAYLESLDGIPGFVARRVLLCALGGHCFPLDERLLGVLQGGGLLGGEDLESASVKLERAVRAGASAACFGALERLGEHAKPPKAQSKRPESKGRSRATSGSRKKS